MLRFLPKSLQARVTLFSLLVFVLGIWGLSVYADRKLRSDMISQIGQRQMATASLVARQINYDLELRLQYLQHVADELGTANFGDAVAVQNHIEQRPLLLRDFLAGVYVVDARGIVIASMPESINRNGTDYSDRGYVNAEGRHTVGRPVVSKTMNSPIIPLSAPVRDARGRVIGALVGAIDLKQPSFLDSITGSRFGKTGYYVLQDKKSRTIITSSGKTRVMERQPPPGVNPLIDRHLSGWDGTGITINRFGKEVLASSRSIPIAGWSVVASLPTDEAFAPVYALERHVFIAASLMTLLAGSLMWWLLRRELRPMFATMDTLTELAKSDRVPELLPVTRDNEIGALITGFNKLLLAMRQQGEILKESEQRWKFAIEGTGDGLWDWNIADGKVFFSTQWKRMLGFAEHEISGSLTEWEKRVHPEDKAEVLRVLNEHLEGRTPVYISEHRVLCKENGYKWILDRGLVVERDAAGSPLRAIGMHTDITDRKRDDEYKKLRNDILVMLAGGASMEQTLNAIVTGIERLNPEMLCSILLLDRDGKRFASGVAPSLPNFYNKEVIGLEIGIGQGSCGTAAFTGERVVVADIASHPYWTPYRDIARRAGLGACWSQPVLSATHAVIGSFAIYHRHPHTPAPADIALIEESAQLVSIAVERDTAEYNQRVAATAFETSKGMMITDPNKIILRVNRAFTAITGYDPQDVIGKTPRILSSDRHDRYFYEVMWYVIKETGMWEGEIWNKRKNGQVYPQYLIINTVRDDNGDITNYVASLEDISHSKEADAKIHNLAFYDPLTQLPNRRLLIDRLDHALAAATRSESYGALILVDLDQFKTVNETLGYEIGDLLLKEVAVRIGSCVSEGDTLGRIGADEFIVLLEDLGENIEEAAAATEVVANRIIAALAASYRLDNHVLHSTVGIGVTLFHNHDISSDELLRQADIAMNQAKRIGNSTLRFFDPAMQAAISARADLENELRMAVDRKQFELHYQIQVDNSGKPLGAEALIRWKHPERGMIPPFQFIPLAEDTGMIVAIGSWVLETACAQLATWQRNPATAALSIAVNVSARQFNQGDFTAQIQSLIKRHGIDPAYLKLELTESMLLEDIDAMIEKMTALQSIGIGFELDDFGTGYSSLQYLKRLPIEQLKIDQSFVRDLAMDDSDKAIVRTIINMAHSLNMKVIAEGVETAEQWAFLKSHGCDHYQGYYFSRPEPIEAFETRIAAIHTP